MTIRCSDLEQFIQTVAGLVRQSVGFQADAETLVITLTGAY